MRLLPLLGARWSHEGEGNGEERGGRRRGGRGRGGCELRHKGDYQREGGLLVEVTLVSLHPGMGLLVSYGPPGRLGGAAG